MGVSSAWSWVLTYYCIPSGNNQEDVDNAERLCRDLVETVKAEYERMKSRPPPPHESYGHSRQYGGGRSVRLQSHESV